MNPIVDESILIESQSARSGHLSKLDHDRANDVLSKAKAIIFALWEGAGRATTEQVAEFYGVPVETLGTVLKRNRKEFEPDGLENVKGQRLQQLKSNLNLSGDRSRHLTVWTPRAALRAAFFLTQSEVAKQVRTLVLNIVEQVPQQSDRIKELELQLAIANANRDCVQSQERILSRNQAIAELHGVQTLALIQGRPGAIVTQKETLTETIVCQDGQKVSFKGKSTAQMAKELGFESGKKLEKWLDSIGESSLVAQGLRAVQAPYIPEENLAELRQVFARRRREGDRQLLLGEEGAA